MGWIDRDGKRVRKCRSERTTLPTVLYRQTIHKCLHHASSYAPEAIQVSPGRTWTLADGKVPIVIQQISRVALPTFDGMNRMYGSVTLNG